jgi:hypothetical protein
MSLVDNRKTLLASAASASGASADASKATIAQTQARQRPGIAISSPMAWRPQARRRCVAAENGREPAIAADARRRGK